MRLFQVFLSTQKADIRNERVVLVDVYMPSIRMAQVNRSVNRTVTLPAWLNAVALERNVNFSQLLQDYSRCTKKGIAFRLRLAPSCLICYS